MILYLCCCEANGPLLHTFQFVRMIINLSGNWFYFECYFWNTTELITQAGIVITFVMMFARSCCVRAHYSFDNGCDRQQ